MQFNRTLVWKIGLPAAALTVLLVVWLSWPRKAPEAPGEGQWTCSMHPQIRQSRPGRCPICAMPLVRVEQLSAEQARIAQQAGLETEPVTYRELFKELRTVGKVDYNERRVAFITARVAGRVDRLYADFTGIQVKKGDHLADIYSPDLVVTAQNLLDSMRSGNQTFAELARERLRLWGLLPEQIREMEASQKAKTHLTIHAPIGGTVIEKSIREGQYVKEGDMLYRIADLDPLWLYLDIYEYDLGWVRYGQRVDVTVEAYPEETFRGTVVFIDPFLDDRTRTVKVRVNLPNPQQKLKPAMYASAVIRVRLRADGSPEPTGLEGKYFCRMHPEVVQDKPGRCPLCEMPLDLVPAVKPPAAPGHAEHMHEEHGPKPKPGEVLAVRAAAVLDTGRRKIAYRRVEGGTYELVELTLGPRAEGKDDAGQTTSYYLVGKGLNPGDRVVVRGGFLLDSQRQIEGMPSLLFPQGQSATSLHSGHGTSTPPPSAPPGSGGHKH